LLISCLSGLLSAACLPAQAGTFAGLYALSAAEGEGDAGEKPKKKGYADEAVKHYNRGVEFHQNGSLNQAVQEYKAAIEADGRLAEAYSNLGAVYLAQKSYAKAAEAFNKALALKPDRPTTLNGLGNALYARGQAAVHGEEHGRLALLAQLLGPLGKGAHVHALRIHERAVAEGDGAPADHAGHALAGHR
jgi:tetratricopeptide (TPR) repeat protein